MYDQFPFIAVGTQDECLVGWDEVIKAIHARSSSTAPTIIECYPGVLLNELKDALASRLPQTHILSTEDLFLSPKSVDEMLEPLLVTTLYSA